MKKGTVLCNLILYPFVGGLKFPLSLPLCMRVYIYIYINVNAPPYLRCTNDLLSYSFPLSPEITNVTFVRTSTERQAENQSCLSAIDDLSIQIEKAKAKASKISSEFLGDFGPPSVSSCMSGSNSTLRTIEKEFSMGCKPTSENLPPLPVKAYELILRLHRLVGWFEFIA